MPNTSLDARDKAAGWSRRNTPETGNPLLAVFDNLAQFVNRTEVGITHEDLQSGKPARDPETRAYILRPAWFPISHDGRLISSGSYIARGAFSYGGDPRD